MTGKHGPRVLLALGGLLVLLTGGASARAQNLFLHTNRECGDAAVFQIGESMRISFGSDRTVNAQLTLVRPDASKEILFSGTLQAGVTREITGVVAAPNG